jgi:hypothetical protein
MDYALVSTSSYGISIYILFYYPKESLLDLYKDNIAPMHLLQWV